jgi:hypothetical protein
MSWTVACFCGNVYAAPPDRCEACGSMLEDAALGDAAALEIQNATGHHGLAAQGVPRGRSRSLDAHGLRDPTVAPR